jgi:hypothetical protein
MIPLILPGHGTCTHLNIIQKIPDKHTGKAQNQGTAENSHIGHCTHASESANLNVQNIEHGA